MVWFIYIHITQIIDSNNQQDELIGEPHFIEGNFFANTNWNIIQKTEMEQALIAVYFAITSLTTTGFGDFYPVTNSERILYSFILLFGVAIFSYFLG